MCDSPFGLVLGRDVNFQDEEAVNRRTGLAIGDEGRQRQPTWSPPGRTGFSQLTCSPARARRA